MGDKESARPENGVTGNQYKLLQRPAVRGGEIGGGMGPVRWRSRFTDLSLPHPLGLGLVGLFKYEEQPGRDFEKKKQSSVSAIHDAFECCARLAAGVVCIYVSCTSSSLRSTSLHRFFCLAAIVWPSDALADLERRTETDVA